MQRTGAKSSGRDTYRHGDLRRALLEAGIELARIGGPDAVVLREATRRAGVVPTPPIGISPAGRICCARSVRRRSRCWPWRWRPSSPSYVTRAIRLISPVSACARSAPAICVSR